MRFSFKPFTRDMISLFLKWTERDHIKKTWFQEGYMLPQDFCQLVENNGYDYPFVILADNHPIGFIITCDLAAYRKLDPEPKGALANEAIGSYSIDLFIGEDDYLGKGYASKIIQSFCEKLFNEFNAKRIVTDPSEDKAIHIYEKAGFRFVRKDHDGVTDCSIIELLPERDKRGEE